MTSMDWIAISALGVVVVMLIYGDELFRIVSAVIVCLILTAILMDQARGATSEPSVVDRLRLEMRPGELLMGWQCR